MSSKRTAMNRTATNRTASNRSATNTNRQKKGHSGARTHSRKRLPAQLITPQEDVFLRKVWRRYHLNREPWPVLGAALAGGAGIAVTSAVGLSELAVGLAMSYAFFRMFREGINPRVAFRQGIRIERNAAGGKKFE